MNSEGAHHGDKIVPARPSPIIDKLGDMLAGIAVRLDADPQG